MDFTVTPSPRVTRAAFPTLALLPRPWSLGAGFTGVPAGACGSIGGVPPISDSGSDAIRASARGDGFSALGGLSTPRCHQN